MEVYYQTMILQLSLFISILMNITSINLVSNQWNIVNDTVMGGKSNAQITNDKDGHLVFTGQVSLENNGGFSMIQSNLKPASPKSVSTVTLTLLGDGKEYQVRLKKNKSDRESYIQTIQTTGEIQTIELSISNFKPQFRGQSLNLPAIQNQSIEQVAFLIGNKKAEAFKLVVHHLELK
jgi:hypothetical protein